jgi:hypothetical protein
MDRNLGPACSGTGGRHRPEYANRAHTTIIGSCLGHIVPTFGLNGALVAAEAGQAGRSWQKVTPQSRKTTVLLEVIEDSTRKDAN